MSDISDIKVMSSTVAVIFNIYINYSAITRVANNYNKTEGTLHSHYIVCYSEQYARLKRNVFSPRRKADVDCVLFSSVGSWFHTATVCSWFHTATVFCVSMNFKAFTDFEMQNSTFCRLQTVEGMVVLIIHSYEDVCCYVVAVLPLRCWLGRHWSLTTVFSVDPRGRISRQQHQAS